MVEFRHLNKKTNDVMELSLDERVRWARKEHFVLYPKAIKCLNQLEWIFSQGDVESTSDLIFDQEGFTIIGDSGVGKSSIVRQFIRMHPSKHLAEHECYPIGYCMLKDSATNLKGLYSAMLGAYKHPYGDGDAFRLKKITVDTLENVLIHMLRKSGTRIFIIDEFQHADGRNQQSILNQLKRTMLVARVPFIPVGTNEVRQILDVDIQLADRCPIKDYSALANWTFDDDFRKFLAGYEHFIPLPEPSYLHSSDLARAIFDRVKFIPATDAQKASASSETQEETNLRRISRFLTKVQVAALKSNKTNITLEDIKSVAN